VLTSASHVNKLSGVVVAVVLLNSLNADFNHIWHLLALLGAHHILHLSRIRVKALHNVHVWHDLPMKYFVLFGERVKPTSRKILQACLNSPCRNSACSRTWASLHCIHIIVFANLSPSTMCSYSGNEPGSRQNFRVYSEICFCVALYISHVIKSLVLCCNISATCISLRQNAC